MTHRCVRKTPVGPCDWANLPETDLRHLQQTAKQLLEVCHVNGILIRRGFNPDPARQGTLEFDGAA